MPAITGDMYVFNDSSGEMEIQVEDLTMASFAVANESEDRELYLKNVWVQDMARGAMTQPSLRNPPEEIEAIRACERVAYCYLRKLKCVTPRRNLPEDQRALFQFVDHVCASAASDEEGVDRNLWERSSQGDITQVMTPFSHLVEIQLMKSVGENLLSFVRGKTAMNEHINLEPLYDRLLNEGIGFLRSNQQVAVAAKQLAHRYPRMKILEIGAGPGSSTKSVLQALESAFMSYTLTDISSDVVADIEKFFSNRPKMIFKTLDFDENLIKQGFSEHSFDLVIASNVLHTATDLTRAMKNIRRLVKPGGYLLLQEPTGELLRFNFMMFGRPEWWSRMNDGRELKPTISPVGWDSLLRECDFGGVDSIAYDCEDVKMHTISVMITQAIDEQIQMLRHPLRVSSTADLPATNILLIGGKSLVTARIVDELHSIFSSWKGNIITAKSFESLDLSVLPSIGAAVSLEDLDTPVIQFLTPRKFENMQQTFVRIRSMLWITNGYRGGNPHCTAMVGLGRSIISESPHLTLQFLDVDTTDNVEMTIAETLVRLMMAELPGFTDNSRLWTTEPELVLENGKILIPRILPLKDSNNRLNSMRRVIKRTAHADDTTVVVTATGEVNDPVYTARESQIAQWPTPKDHLKVHVTHCTAYPLKVSESTYLYICIGSVVGKGEKVLALSTSNASFTTVPTSWQIPLLGANGTEAKLLETVARHLCGRSILNAVARAKTTILFDPDEQLAATIQTLTSGVDNKPIFLTSSTRPIMSDVQWRVINPWTPRRIIQSLLPLGTTLFLNLSIKDQSALSRIKRCLPASCSTRNFFQSESVCPDGVPENFQEVLLFALNASRATSVSSPSTSIPPVVNVSDILAGSKPTSFFTIVDWASNAVIPTLQRPIDASTLFSANKTYLLVGLTGDLGQSICKWMVESGARNLIVSSR